MTNLYYEAKTSASPEKIWEILADLGGVMYFHPYVENSYYISEDKEGVGAARICEFFNGMKIEETAADWQPGKSYTVNVAMLAGMTPPIDTPTGELGLEADSDGTCIYMRITYTPRYGLLGRVMDRVMIRRQYEKMIPNILRGLKHYAETGEVVDYEVFKKLESIPTAV